MAIQVKHSHEPYHVSKWLSVALLIDENEMQSLFTTLGDFFIFTVGNITKRGVGEVPHEVFLKGYAHYVNALKEGRIPEDQTYRTLFSSVFTAVQDHVYALNVGEEGQLIRIFKPVVQLQVHHLDYSTADGKFRPMVFGKDSVLWGLQFSYPQLFEDPKDHSVHKVEENANFPNTALFRAIQKWVRENTKPTPFVVDGKIINVPMRLGKSCFEWINKHPQLAMKPFRISQKE